MLQRLKKQWSEFSKAQPGSRFKERYRSRQRSGRSGLAKPLYMAGGLVILIVGIVLLPAPGPGLLIAALGAALIAKESYLAASALDRMEVKLRPLLGAALGVWKRAPLALRVLVAVLGAGVIGLTGYSAYVLLFAS